MTSLRLAYRNLRRNRRRTALTAIALGMGLLMLLAAQGLLDGVDGQSIDNLIRYDTAHIKAFLPGYMDEDFPTLDYAFTGADSFIQIAGSVAGIEAGTARLNLTGMLIHQGEEIFVSIVGVDVQSDPKVFETLNALVEGNSLTDGNPTMLLGDRLAREYGISVGDQLMALVRSQPGALNTRTLTVSGIISTGHPKVDKFEAYVPLSLARELVLLPDGATELAFKTGSIRKVETIADKISGRLESYDIRTWHDLTSDFTNLAQMKRVGSGIIIAILALMAAVGIANTMVIAVHERTREVGALRAMGFSSGLIGRMFIWEGTLIGVIAGLCAVLVGSIIIAWLGNVGISLAMYGDMDIGYPIRDAMYPKLTVGAVLGTFLFGLAVALLASWGSARRAARGQVVRALREGML